MKYKYCYHCGRKIPALTRFCSYCGAKQNDITGLNKSLETRGKKQYKRPNYETLDSINQHSKKLLKPFRQRVQLIIIPMAVVIYYFDDFTTAVDYATGGTSSSDQGAGTMGTFPISSRFGVIFFSLLPVIISFFLSCNRRLWVQIISICLELFGLSELLTYTQESLAAISIKSIAIVLVALLIFSRINIKSLLGRHFGMYCKIKVWIARILVVLTVLVILASLHEFYLLLQPMLVIAGIFIGIGILSSFIPDLRIIITDGFGIFHEIF